MGLFSFLRRKKPVEAELPPASGPPSKKPEPTEAPADHAEIDKLGRVGLPGGPTAEEAVYMFAALRGTADEARAVEELVRTTQIRSLPEPVLLSLGAALVDRGQPDVATKALETATSAPSLVLRADLAERRRDFAGALSLIERVLLRDIDYPGARERHKRWRIELGYDAPHKAAAPGATVMTREPDAPFDLLREVGRGGAGAVYEAVDRELERHVALKVYHRPDRDKEQLTHEARVAVALEGPGVVRVFDLDPEHGWIALEWAAKGTLRDGIRANNVAQLLPLDRWAIPLAQALERVHRSGWVHHDIKPANVLLSRTGEAILTDFGSARRVGEPSPPGSLGYISPERMRGRASDPRDDVYAFGRLLEDVLVVVPDASIVARYRPLALACMAADEARPIDARAIVTRMKVEVLGK